MRNENFMISQVVRKLNEVHAMICDQCRQPSELTFYESVELKTGGKMTDVWLCRRCWHHLTGEPMVVS